MQHPLTVQFASLQEKQRQAAQGRPKPQMGWSSWNFFRQNITEEAAYAVAAAMKSTGLVDAGYQYLNLDDCWQASALLADGCLQFDPGTFPSGANFVRRVNALGMKLGLYSSCGELTCEDLPGSAGFEAKDAESFARWGVSYLKYDYCHVVDLPTDEAGDRTFPTQTPPFCHIGLTPLSEEGESPTAELTLWPEAARCTGSARVEDGLLRGLCCGRGKAEFSFFTPKEGRYALSICYQKSKSLRRQFAMVSVGAPNGIGGEENELWFPRSSGWSDTGRVNTIVWLIRGENRLCFYIPITGQKEDSKLRYRRMGRALAAAAQKRGNPIAFSVCEHGRAAPWEWAAEFASSWRVRGDIHDDWASVVACYEKAAGLWQFQRPGAYNDPDMLEVGVGNLTAAENRAHFSLWCMLSAPLILGLDARQLADASFSAVREIVTNPRLIALNQDGLMLQARRISEENGIDILVKPLAGGEAAVLFFNKEGPIGADSQIDLAALWQADERVTLLPAGGYAVQNLWKENAFRPHGPTLSSGPLPEQGVSVFRVRQAL